ncbi:MAG: hypothetical protein ACPGSL_04215 [Vicingaceae bacterium]
MAKLCWILIGILFFIFSCSKENEAVNADLGYAYAGLEVGNYVVYDVDSFFYDDFDNTIDSNYYKIKEEVDSKFIDLEGEDAFKIIRYRKQNDTTDWVVTDVWTSKITASNYQKVEENIRFIKLIFPARDSKTWNGNALNNNGAQVYEYDGVDESENIGGNNLSNVLTVLQLEEINLIEEKIFKEKYAEGVGLVYKKSVDVTKTYNNSTGLFEKSLGYDVTMTLSTYGN